MSYLPNTDAERAGMLAAVGVARIEDLFADIPEAVRLKGSLDLPPALGEDRLLATFRRLAGKNRHAEEMPCFLGGGSTDRFIPSLVAEVIERAEFLTAYTPYQAEISQGTLQVIYEFQTLMSELTGMEIAQASMYDGASAVAEAASLAQAATGRRRAVVMESVDPMSRGALQTYARGRNMTVVTVPSAPDGTADLAAVRTAIDDDTACVILQDPNFFGLYEEVEALAECAHARGALVVAQVDPVAMAVVTPPGVWGADVAVGEGQPLGVPMGYGGPYLGFFAARESLVRRLPGRLVGATYDTRGRRGYVLTFQTREQHIRREKATSNICTNQGLLALAACVYLAALGPEGLREAAHRSIALSHEAARGIAALPGFSLATNRPFFDEFAVRLPDGVTPHALERALLDEGILGGSDLGVDYPERRGQVLFAVTERRTLDEVRALVRALGKVGRPA